MHVVIIPVLDTTIRSVFFSPTGYIYIVINSPESSVPQVRKTQFSHPFLIPETPQHLNNLPGTFADLTPLCSFVLMNPALDTVIQMYFTGLSREEGSVPCMSWLPCQIQWTRLPEYMPLLPSGPLSVHQATLTQGMT